MQHGIGEDRWEVKKVLFVYKGQFDSGNKTGLGKLIFKDGSFYEGSFVQGNKHGPGKYYFAQT